MKKIIAIACFVLVLFPCLQAQKKNTPKNAKLDTKQAVSANIVAHRGFYKFEGSAENSISSMQNSLDHDFYGTEFDVQVTIDDNAIVFHDTKVNDIIISEVPFEIVTGFDAYKLKNGETIPMLKDYLSACVEALEMQRPRGIQTKLFCEIKPCSRPERSARAVEYVVELFTSYGLIDNVQFLSFDFGICKKLIKIVPNKGHVFYLGGQYPPKTLYSMGIFGIDYEFKLLLEHPEWVKEAHELNMTVGCWTVNDKDTAIEISRLGVDFITTDLPLDVQSWLEEAK